MGTLDFLIDLELVYRMNIFEVLLNVLQVGLTLWDDKEKNKYVDQLIQLKKDYYDEQNKSDDERSDAMLDNIREQLCILGTSFSSSASKQNVANK